MQFPALTAGYAAILALIYLALAAQVSAGRLTLGVSHGDGGQPGMLVRMRTHANFGEYVPFILILTALLEGGGSSRIFLHALLLPLTVARAVHPFGMVAPPNTLQQRLLRGVPMLVTWLVMALAALVLLLRVL